MKRSPTILALVTDAFGGRGGIAQYNRDLLGALAGSVSSITVVPRHAPDLTVALPDRIEQTRARPGRMAYTVAALRAALCRPADVVYCGHLFMAPLAVLVARLKGAKLIVQTYGVEAWSRPTRPQRAALEAADLVLCISRHTRAAVLNWAAIASERVVVLPCTVRDAFTPGDSSALRSELGLQGKRVLLTVARLDPQERYKGHDRVIALLSDLVAQGHDVAYVVVGEGGDRPRLEALVLKTVGSERVRFLGGVGLERLVDAYRMADLFVLPSTGEGFGIAFLEAMVSGTPALGLDVAGARDALADGQLGTAVSQAELPVAIARLLVEPKPDPGVLAAAARARFGRETFAAGARTLLNRVMGASELDDERAHICGHIRSRRVWPEISQGPRIWPDDNPNGPARQG
jgi:phosphatidylinositol alpha-1,6-mannosyltransferase